MNDIVVIPSISPEQSWQLSNRLPARSVRGAGAVRNRRRTLVRAFLPGADAVEVVARSDGRRLGTLSPTEPAGLFMGRVEGHETYRFRIQWPGAVQEVEIPTPSICC